MSVQHSTAARTSSTFVHEVTGAPVTSDQLLRMFDVHRRELAIQVTGQEGSGAGYDDLRLHGDELGRIAKGDHVTVTAMLGVVRQTRHLVHYTATAADPRGRCSVLAEARGWTLGRVSDAEGVADERA